VYKRTGLDNGMVVVSEKLPHLRSVALGIWVRSGSRFEGPDEKGISHLLEHLYFKGTEKRSARQISEEMDSIGGQLNAFTSKEYSCYYARVLDDHLPQAMELLSDMLKNSTFAEEDIRREVAVVGEEIRLYLDSPDDYIHDMVLRATWGQHRLADKVLGEWDVLEGLQRDSIAAYREQHYTADDMVIAAAGNLEHSRLLDLVEQHFGYEGDSGKALGTEPPSVNAEVLVKEKDIEQVHICVGAEGLPLNHEQIYVLHVLNTILGGGTSSRLFQEIREERGLAYSVYSYSSAYSDAGLLGIYAGTGKDTALDVLTLIYEELAKIRADGVSATEVKRVKEQVKGSLMLSLESTSNRMARLGKSEVSLNRYRTPEEIIEKVESVTEAEVAEMAARIFDPGRLSLAVVGPISDEEIRSSLNP